MSDDQASPARAESWSGSSNADGGGWTPKSPTAPAPDEKENVSRPRKHLDMSHGFLFNIKKHQERRDRADKEWQNEKRKPEKIVQNVKEKMNEGNSRTNALRKNTGGQRRFLASALSGVLGSELRSPRRDPDSHDNGSGMRKTVKASKEPALTDTKQAVESVATKESDGTKPDVPNTMHKKDKIKRGRGHTQNQRNSNQSNRNQKSGQSHQKRADNVAASNGKYAGTDDSRKPKQSHSKKKGDNHTPAATNNNKSNNQKKRRHQEAPQGKQQIAASDGKSVADWSPAVSEEQNVPKAQVKKSPASSRKHASTKKEDKSPAIYVPHARHERLPICQLKIETEPGVHNELIICQGDDVDKVLEHFGNRYGMNHEQRTALKSVAVQEVDRHSQTTIN